MKSRLTFFVFSLVAFVTLSSFTPITTGIYAQKGWKQLGSRKVNFGLDKDVIMVTAAEGAFTKLKLKVTGGSLNMHKMTVHYANGTKQDIVVKHNFARGGATRVIDLKGCNRVIRKITFWYDTKNRSSHRATLHVFGRH